MRVSLQHRGLLFLILLAAAAVAGYATRLTWLEAMSSLLVVSHTPEPADIVVVLAGGTDGQRLLRAVELVEQGYAPRILVDGAGEFYGLEEAAMAVDFAVKRGASPPILDPFPIEADSTYVVVKTVDQELARRGIHKALVVTSNYHTRRARNLFERLTSGKVKYLIIAAPAVEFKPDGWWRTREGKKTLVLEYLKTVYSWYELMFAA